MDSVLKIQYPKTLNYPIGDIANEQAMFDTYASATISMPEDEKADLSRRNREKEILASTPVPQIYAQTLNLSAISNLLNQDFYQYNVEEGVFVLSNELLVGKNLMQTSQKVHEEIKSLKVLASGANGSASVANIGAANGLFTVIVKTSLNPQDDDLMHEVFVGLAGTNKLRKQIPNFSFVYGGFQCGPLGPADKTKQIKTFCEASESQVVTYALYENIKGESLEKSIINGISGDSFMSVLMQVLLAINYSNITIDFTHYDLHPGNIICRQPYGDEIFGMEYYLQDGSPRYVYSSAIATFIDYGQSHIKYKGQDYGIDLHPFDGQNGFKSYPLFDAFKIIAFCTYYGLTTGNQEVYDVCQTLMLFFTPYVPDANLMNDWRKIFFGLQYDPKMAGYSIETLISYIEKNIDLTGTYGRDKSTQFRLLECSTTCMTLTQVEKEITSA